MERTNQIERTDTFFSYEIQNCISLKVYKILNIVWVQKSCIIFVYLHGFPYDLDLFHMWMCSEKNVNNLFL